MNRPQPIFATLTATALAGCFAGGADEAPLSQQASLLTTTPSKAAVTSPRDVPVPTQAPSPTLVTAESVGELCTSTEDVPFEEGEIVTTAIDPGERLTVQVTYPGCLSSTCDLAPQASCAVERIGNLLLVDAQFSFVELVDELCTLDCQRLSTTCTSEPLEEGAYEVVYAGSSASVRVPGTVGTCPIDVPRPPECQLDEDCTDGWCNEDVNGVSTCLPYAQEGEACGGYAPGKLAPRCAPDLECVYGQDDLPDAPGTCEDPVADGLEGAKLNEPLGR